jgi:diguanylate cyclase (GGDEF)-like protein/PAS domain S-box-containing protein
MDEVIGDVIAFLTRWLASHILESDRYLAMVVLAMQAGMPLELAKKHASEQLNGSIKVLIDIILSIYENLSTNALQLMNELAERRREGNLLRKLSLAVEQSFCSIVITDLDANIEFVNDAFVRTTGYLRSEAVGHNISLLQSGHTTKETYRSLWATLRRGEVWRGEFVNKRKDGNEYVELASISPVYQADGTITHYLAVNENITERKQAESQLVESEKRFRVVADAAPVMIWMSGTDMLCTWFNLGWLSFTGRTMAQELGNGWAEGVHPDDLSRCLDIYVGHFERQKPFCMEYRLKRHDDEFRWLRDNGVPRFGADGKFEGYIGSCIDVSDQITARDEVFQAKEELENILYAATAVGIIATDPNGLITTFNRGAELMLGYAAEEMIGKQTLALIHLPAEFELHFEELTKEFGYPPSVSLFDAFVAKAKRWGQETRDWTYVRKDKSTLTVSLVVTAIRDRKGNISGYLGVATDITQRKLAEQQLSIAATVFESQQGMLITDANNAILRVNKAFSAITGYAATDVIGENPRILQSGRQSSDFYAAMWSSINNTGSWEGEIWNRRKTGEVYPEYANITAVKDSSGNITHYVGTFIDITLKKAAAEEIERLAFYDPLTGLPNRRLLLDRLKPALAASHRNGRKGALLFIDLDHFKSLNDTLGHDMGDLLLQQVAERLRGIVREGDTVARLGGDEFVVMLEDLSDQILGAAQQTEIIGNKIIAVINQPFQLATHNYLTTPSIGAALFNGQENSVDELLKQADIAMYQSKTSGRNSLRFFDSNMQDVITARVLLEDDLRRALDVKQFQLHYQIQVDHSGRPIGAEALIRWIHPKRGLVSPAEFIPLAEETGLILPIDQWVLETACAQLKAWQQDPFTRGLVLSVNISAKQFFQADFVTRVQEVIQYHAINSGLLKLELTESLLVENIEDTIATMNALGAMGVQFSLDDFGTGYSSLQYLKKLPLDQLKIDQSFIRGIAVDSGDQAIACAIIAMAASLKLNVIAEGVETEEQRQFLLHNGCMNFQGYLFGKPVPIGQFEVR